MYCSKCGKEIDYDAMMCLDCVAIMAMQAREAKKAAGESPRPNVNYVPASIPVREQKNDADTNATVTPSENTRKKGLGKAILSNVFPCVSVLVLYAALMSIILGLNGAVGTLSLIFLALNVIAFIFAIQSIRTFRRVVKEGKPAPIATLILGICSLPSVVSAVIIGAIYFILFVLIALVGNIELDYNIFDYSYFYS